MTDRSYYNIWYAHVNNKFQKNIYFLQISNKIFFIQYANIIIGDILYVIEQLKYEQMIFYLTFIVIISY